MLYLHPSGKVKSGSLAASTKIGGLTLPAASMFFLSEGGSLVSSSAVLTQDHSLLGVGCAAGSSLYVYRLSTSATKSSLQAFCLAASSPVSFAEDGTLTMFELESSKVLQGVHCAAGSVSFFTNGRLSVATLSKPSIIQGVLLQEQTTVYFYENGKLQSGILAEPQLIQKVLYEGALYFYEDGVVLGGVLTKDTKIQGKLFLKGTYVEYDEAGNVNAAE
jgi:hypothetical protein